MNKVSQVYKKIKDIPTGQAIDMLSKEWIERIPPRGIRKEKLVPIEKKAGLFERIAKHMDSHLWMSDKQHLLPFVRDYILRRIHKFIPKESIKQIVLIGSTTGLQYKHTSDVDINVVLDPPELVKELWEVRREQNEIPIPGTRHPLNIYLQPFRGTIPDYQDSYFGIYDILNDEWLVKPPEVSTYRKPEDKFWTELISARLLANEFKRKVDRYEQSLKEKNSMGSSCGCEVLRNIKIERRIERDLQELILFTDELQNGRDFAYNWGWGIPRVGYRNIVYKFIHNMLPDKYEKVLLEIEELKHKIKAQDVHDSRS